VFREDTLKRIKLGRLGQFEGRDRLSPDDRHIAGGGRRLDGPNRQSSFVAVHQSGTGTNFLSRRCSDSGKLTEVLRTCSPDAGNGKV
jgi:hypothetical protein